MSKFAFFSCLISKFFTNFKISWKIYQHTHLWTKNVVDQGKNMWRIKRIWKAVPAEVWKRKLFRFKKIAKNWGWYHILSLKKEAYWTRGKTSCTCRLPIYLNVDLQVIAERRFSRLKRDFLKTCRRKPIQLRELLKRMKETGKKRGEKSKNPAIQCSSKVESSNTKLASRLFHRPVAPVGIFPSV